ncbi:MAG TPA: hypothetical protein IGR64_13505 [Leptolyngbyaceae cyanobacterium M65_K2018_010]|nr:hypothetical protein [Leptolyngbyaceae cyanobacterium M65_K2018_010]
MKQINGILSVLGATAISAFALPTLANTATVQSTTQSTTINGDNNQVIQVINQVNVSHPGLGRGRTNNAQRATSQDSYQAVGIEGSGNSVGQESTQVNREERVDQPGQRAGQTRASQSRDSDNGRRAQKQGSNSRRGQNRGDNCEDD